MNITFIGLGVMGSRMARNLMDNGVELTVHNRTREKAEPLIERGATYRETSQGAVEEADVVFTMLSQPEAVDEVALAKDGFVQAMKPGALWVDCSTVNPAFTKKSVEHAQAHEVRFVDAPVAGSKGPAEQGELTFLVGGEDQDVNEIKSLLDFMGKKTVHVGEITKGTSMKMVVNIMLAANMATFAEAMVLGEQLGLSRDFLFEALPNMPVAAPFLQAKADHMKNDNYEEEFALKHMQKDLHLASLSGYEEEAALKLTNLIKETYAEAKVNGYGDIDFSGIYAYYRALHGKDK